MLQIKIQGKSETNSSKKIRSILESTFVHTPQLHLV